MIIIIIIFVAAVVVSSSSGDGSGDVFYYNNLNYQKRQVRFYYEVLLQLADFFLKREIGFVRAKKTNFLKSLFYFAAANISVYTPTVDVFHSRCSLMCKRRVQIIFVKNIKAFWTFIAFICVSCPSR